MFRLRAKRIAAARSLNALGAKVSTQNFCILLFEFVFFVKPGGEFNVVVCFRLFQKRVSSNSYLSFRFRQPHILTGRRLRLCLLAHSLISGDSRNNLLSPRRTQHRYWGITIAGSRECPCFSNLEFDKLLPTLYSKSLRSRPHRESSEVVS